MEKVITHFGVFLIFFMNKKCQWGKTCVQVHVFHDLATANRQPVRAGTVVSIVVFSIQTEVEVIA